MPRLLLAATVQPVKARNGIFAPTEVLLAALVRGSQHLLWRRAWSCADNGNHRWPCYLLSL